MKLDIYNKNNIVKTYTLDKYAIKFFTVEDFFETIKIDELKSTDNDAIFELVLKALPRSMPIIKQLIQDVFDDISEDEIRNTKMQDITTLIVDIVKYAIKEMSIGINSKN